MQIKTAKLKENLMEYSESIIEKTVENHEDFKTDNIGYWASDLLETLCFSFSSVISDFIWDNSQYFLDWKEYDADGDGNEEDFLDSFIDEVIVNNCLYGPFIEKEPVEFFDVIEDYVKTVLIPEVKKELNEDDNDFIQVKTSKLNENLMKYSKNIIDKMLEAHTAFKTTNVEYLASNLLTTLCFSFSDIISEFILDNTEYFLDWTNYDSERDGDVDSFMNTIIDDVVSRNCSVGPFEEREPVEFFDAIKDYVKSVIIPALMK